MTGSSATSCGSAYLSVSHKRFGVSYCEIRRARVHGTLLRPAVTSADLGYIGLAERSISRCGTHRGLCDRLKNSGCAGGLLGASFAGRTPTRLTARLPADPGGMSDSMLDTAGSTDHGRSAPWQASTGTGWLIAPTWLARPSCNWRCSEDRMALTEGAEIIYVQVEFCVPTAE